MKFKMICEAVWDEGNEWDLEPIRLYKKLPREEQEEWDAIPMWPRENGEYISEVAYLRMVLK